MREERPKAARRVYVCLYVCDERPKAARLLYVCAASGRRPLVVCVVCVCVSDERPEAASRVYVCMYVRDERPKAARALAGGCGRRPPCRRYLRPKAACGSR